MFGIYWVWGPCMPAQSLQSCVTLCDHMDCSPPGSSVHGILQASILEWVAMPFSRGSSWPRDWTHIYLHLLHCRRILYPLSHLGSPSLRYQRENQVEKSTRKLKGLTWKRFELEESKLKYPSCYWHRSSHWSYNIVKRKIEKKQESDLWGYTHLSTP